MQGKIRHLFEIAIKSIQYLSRSNRERQTIFHFLNREDESCGLVSKVMEELKRTRVQWATQRPAWERAHAPAEWGRGGPPGGSCGQEGPPRGNCSLKGTDGLTGASPCSLRQFPTLRQVPLSKQEASWHQSWENTSSSTGSHLTRLASLVISSFLWSPRSRQASSSWQYLAAAAAAVVQLLSRIQRFVTSWTAAGQASLSITNSRSLLKLMSIESEMPPNHLILCRPLLLLPSIFPSIRDFSNESAVHIRWRNTGVSASASVLPTSIQGWFPVRLTGWISLQSKGLSGGSLVLLHFLPLMAESEKELKSLLMRAKEESERASLKLNI